MKKHPLSPLTACLLIAASAAVMALPARAEVVVARADTSAARTRWQADLAAFAAADRDRLPATGGTLFVGSSTIRLWSTLQQDFRSLPVVINRGFGGSTMADCDHFSRELVTRYRPRQVLVYAGDNDLAEGRTPEQILASFVSFVHVVRGELPQAHISYISIKPSPSRAALLPRVREANRLIAAYAGGLENVAYVDIFTPMLNAEGKPRPELFRADQLHMNDAGYALWQSVIAPLVLPEMPSAAAAAAAGVAAIPPVTPPVSLAVSR